MSLEEEAPKGSGTQDHDDRQDLRNYTAVPEDFFNDIYREVGNENEILKIVDSKSHPEYYVFTDFLIDKEY